MTSGQALLIMWITFTVLAVVGMAAVLVWAVRARQFADQDRARHLPLLCDDYRSEKIERPCLEGKRT
jgi:cbb3-type cytochrome oxidase maturation protein